MEQLPEQEMLEDGQSAMAGILDAICEEMKDLLGSAAALLEDNQDDL